MDESHFTSDELFLATAGNADDCGVHHYPSLSFGSQQFRANHQVCLSNASTFSIRFICIYIFLILDSLLLVHSSYWLDCISTLSKASCHPHACKLEQRGIRIELERSVSNGYHGIKPGPCPQAEKLMFNRSRLQNKLANFPCYSK